MRRIIQYSLAGCLLAAALLGIITLQFPGQAADGDYPKVEPLKHKNYTEKIPGSEVQFEMVAIPGGAYLMGSPDNEKGRDEDEGPLHPVSIKPFWMGKCEVTWDEYDLYWRTEEGGPKEDKEKKDPKDADAITRPTPPYADETFGHGRDGHPVMCITQHAAMEYCRWLSKKTGKHYRLPTEAEWEWACRAGTKTAYFFGDDPKPLGDYAWFAANAEEGTHPVGKKKANPWGLHDILGNLGEWCLDHYQKDYYAKFPKDKLTLQPVFLPTAGRMPHVFRGGAWEDQPDKVRCATRRFSHRDFLKRDPQKPQSIWWLTDAEIVGVRLVCAVEEQDNLKGIRSKVTRKSKYEPHD